MLDDLNMVNLTLSVLMDALKYTGICVVHSYHEIKLLE